VEWRDLHKSQASSTAAIKKIKLKFSNSISIKKDFSTAKAKLSLVEMTIV